MSEAVVTYGSYTINDASAARFAGVTSYRSNLERGAFDFEVIVSVAEGAALDTSCEALEAAFRERNNDFRVQINGEDVIDWRVSQGNSVLNSPEFRKIGGPYDTRNSRRYRISITAELPANVQGRAGERPYSWSVSRDDNLIRTLTLSGQYTAFGGSTAYEVYEANSATLATTVQDLVDADALWQQISETVDTDDEGGVASYSLTWREATEGGTLTYGGFTVGGASATYPIYGELSIAREYEQVRIRADVLIVAANASALATAESTLTDAFRKPRQDLTVQYGGTNAFTGTQAAGTVIDAMPTVERGGDPSFAGVAARTYRITIVAQLPADNLGLDGRRESNITFSYSPSRRRQLTITGTYTSFGATATGEAAYAAQIATYQAAVESAAGGDWELIGEQTDSFETRKVLSFSRTIQEIPYSERYEMDSVRDQRVVIVANVPGLQDSADITGRAGGASEGFRATGSVERPIEVRAAISGSVVFTLAQAAWDQLLEDAYQFLTARISERVGGQLAVMQESRDADQDNRTFSVTISGTVANTGWLSLRISESISQDPGIVVEKAWGGTKLSAYVYEVPGNLVSTITRNGTHLGDPPPFDPPAPDIDGTTAILAGPQRDDITPITMGRLDTGDSYTIFDVSAQRTWEHYEPIEAGGTGG